MTDQKFSRRSLLRTSGVAAGGVAVGAVGGSLVTSAVTAERQRTAVDRAVTEAVTATEQRVREASFYGAATVPFHGVHQAGVMTPAQAHASFVALDLRDGATTDSLRKLLVILTDDITRLMGGRAPLGDTAPQLASTPANLTITLGVGPSLFDTIGRPDLRPVGLADLPAFPEIDQLEDAWSGGDLVLQICSDDPTTVAHAQRMLFKDSRAFAEVRWIQRGFLHGKAAGPDSTARNLMGQVDGTVNPVAETEFDDVVWHRGDDWFAGGTQMVVRRIRLHMDSWDELDPSAMESSMGRRLANGAPLTGENEDDEPDFEALDVTGLKAIADFAHIRVARGDGPRLQIQRRPYNYDHGDTGSDLGQVFCSFQADIEQQFLPMQRRLAQGDLFNEWQTPIGSAVFAVLPGCAPGGFLGEGLVQ